MAQQQATDAQIKAWEKKHKSVFEYEHKIYETVTEKKKVYDSEKSTPTKKVMKEQEVEVKKYTHSVFAYFKKPGLKELAIMNHHKDNEIEAAEALYNNCVIQADPIFEEDDLLKLAAIGTLTPYLNVVAGTLKKRSTPR